MKCDIIAAGESLRGFDFTQLTNFRIVLNNVCWYIPHDMNVWFDPVQKFYSQEEINKIKGLETLTTNGGRWVKSNVRDIVRGSNEVSACNSSLILAVNIAINLGYKEIDIYGADFRVIKYTHFYDEVETPKDKLKFYNNCYSVVRVMWDKLTFLEDEKINLIKL